MAEQRIRILASLHNIFIVICTLGETQDHPGGNPGTNLKSISHRCYLFEVAFVWELTKETIVLPLGCLQGGCTLVETQDWALSAVGPADPSFRALSGRLKFTVRRRKFNKDVLPPKALLTRVTRQFSN